MNKFVMFGAWITDEVLADYDDFDGDPPYGLTPVVHAVDALERGEAIDGHVDFRISRSGGLIDMEDYSAALDEIYRLRTALAYEADIIYAHLGMATFPKSRRPHAEKQIERMRASARGDAEKAYADRPTWSASHSRQTAGMPASLTRSDWEQNRGRPVPNPREDPDEAYRHFMAMDQPQWLGLLTSLAGGGVLTPAEQVGFERAREDRPIPS